MDLISLRESRLHIIVNYERKRTKLKENSDNFFH
jgi:hypothetical protein